MKKKNKKIILAGIILIVALAGCALARERHLIYLLRSGSAARPDAVCDDSLWKFNAEDETVITPCLTLTGVVQSRHSEDDGDENIKIKPDPDYVHLLNIWNILGQGGNIAVEPICEDVPTKKKFISACQGYQSALTLPQVGDHVSVTGSYGTDQHGWTEIHPVTKIVILPAR